MELYVKSLTAVYELLVKERLPLSAQLLIQLLLHLDYCFGRGGEFRVTDRELGLRSGLAKQSITDAKRILKNRGFIDFKTDKEKPQKGTIYKILIGRESEEEVGQSKGRFASEKPLLNSPASGARATAEKESSPHTPFKEKNLSIYPSIPQAGGRDVSFFEEQLERLLEFWEKELLGGRLTVEHQAKLFFHLKEKGLSWVKDVMKEAANSNSNPRGLQPKFFFACLTKKLENEKNTKSNSKPKDNIKENCTIESNSQTGTSLTTGTWKGNWKNGNSGREGNNELKPPVRSGNEEWTKY